MKTLLSFLVLAITLLTSCSSSDSKMKSSDTEVKSSDTDIKLLSGECIRGKVKRYFATNTSETKYLQVTFQTSETFQFWLKILPGETKMFTAFCNDKVSIVSEQEAEL